MGLKNEKGTKRRTGLTLGTSMITILVGLTSEKFIMHRDRVCELSGYFRGLLSGNFNDAIDGTTTLKEESVRGFRLFQHCVYNNKFPEDLEDIEEVLGGEDGEEGAVAGIVQFYVLADQLILEGRFKLQAIRTFTRSILPGGIPGGKGCGRKLTSREVNPALLLLPEQDPFLKLVIDITAYQYLKRKGQVASDSHSGADIVAGKAEIEAWLEDCIADVATGRIVKLFSAMAEFTKGWCMSNKQALMLDRALTKGVDKEKRYAIGFLSEDPGLGFSAENLAAADDGGDVKRARLE